MKIDDAYARCAEITRHEAKNFAYGIRLLPPPKRAAMSAVYALARRIDDIGDGSAAPVEKLAALDAVRRDLDGVRAGRAPDDDPVLLAVADSAVRFAIPLDGFDDLVTGCELDARGAHFATYDELVLYCRFVAGSIGRLSLAVFGTDDPELARPLADALGVALQLTNILRDVVEDRSMGRVYLPAEDRARFGVRADVSGPRDAVARLVSFEAQRAATWFEHGLRLLPLLDHRSRACVAAMAGIYRRLLRRIDADPLQVLERRVSLPTREKAWVALRSLAGASA